MSTKPFTVTIHMVASVDGFIAKKDGSVDWMHSSDNYEQGIELSKEYIEQFLKSIDCYVMGSHTYEQALSLGWPYGEVPVVVVTTRNLVSDRKNVSFYSGNLQVLIEEQLKPQYQNVWMVGGAYLTKEFIRLDLAHDIVISIIPTILGDGILFFDFVGCEKKLHLRAVEAYKDGMVELKYELIKTQKGVVE